MIGSKRVALLGAIGATALSSTAMAHGEADWLHAAMDGAVMLVTALEFLLPVFLVSLLAGRRVARFVFLQAAVLGIGLLLGLWVLPGPADLATIGLYARVYLIGLGLLVLFDLRLYAGVVLLLLLATGGVTGLEARSAITADPAAGLVLTFGFVLSAICLYLPTALIASRFGGGWQRIAIRVAASWIAAIAAVDVAFMIAPPG